MRKAKFWQSTAAALVSGSMILAAMPLPAAAEDQNPEDEAASENNDAHPTEKTETVYMFIDGDGKISKTLVSSWLHDDDGIDGISETLNLSDVKNVKTDEEPAISGNTYTWSVKGNDVYYQGTSSKTAPVQAALSYELDGQKLSAEQLKGKSGHLKMTITLNSMETKTVNIDGKQIIIHPAFAAGGLLDLDNDVFTNVKCGNGKSINDGDKEFLVFAAIPGLKQTLESAGLEDFVQKTGLSDSIVIESDVKNFEMPALYLAASNDLHLDQISDLNLDSLTSQMQQLFNAADELKNGAGQLADGTSQLKAGIVPLSSAQGQIALMSSGFMTLNQGSTKLADGVHAYVYGVEKLHTGNSQLYRITDGIKQMKDTVDAKNSLKDGAAALSSGLTQLNQQVSSIDASSLSGLNDQLNQAMAALKQLEVLLDQDLSTMQTMKQTLEGACQQAFSIASSVQSSAENLGKTAAADNALIQSDNQKIASFNTTLSASRKSAQDSIAQATSELNALKQANPDLDFSTAEASLEQADAQIAQIAEVPALDTLQPFSESDLNTLNTSLQKLSELSSSMNSSMDALNGLKNDLDTSIGTLQGLKSQLETVSDSDSFQKLMNSLTQLKQAANSLDEGGKQVSQGVDKLSSSLETLYDQSKAAFDQINAGSGQLTANSLALTSGVDALKEGTGTLAASTDQLAQLQSGISDLTSAVSQLNDGAQQLASGTDQFDEEGMGKLKEIMGWTEDQIELFKDICNASIEFNEAYSNFAGAPKNAQTSVRYIFKYQD